jgi:predicted PurR-regulated permease PerM
MSTLPDTEIAAERRLPFRDVLLVVVLVGIVVLAGMMAAPFVAALLWAMVLSILTYPMYDWVKRRWEGHPFLGSQAENIAGLAAVFATVLIVLLPLGAVAAGLVVQLQSLNTEASAGSGQATGWESFLGQVDAGIRPIAERFGAPNFSLQEYVNTNREELVENLRTPATAAARNAIITAVTLVIALVTQFFMLRDGHRLREPAIRLLPIPHDVAEATLKKLQDTAWAVFTGTVLVSLIQGGVLGLTLALLGVPNSILLGVVAFIMCMIPLLGSPFVYVPVALVLLSQGETQKALILLAVGFIIVSNIDNALRPFFIGGRANLHPIGIFYAILGGVLLFGPIGIMAGPMLLTIALAVLDVVKARMALSRNPDDPEQPAEPNPAMP